MAFSGITTSAWSAGEPAKQATQTSTVAKNQSPLPAGGAAGIKQAQGDSDNSAYILGGLLVGSIILALLYGRYITPPILRMRDEALKLAADLAAGPATSLGLTKMHRSVELEMTPQVKGMIGKVQHLVEVKEI